MTQARDSMLDPKYIGGVIGGQGYAFQNAYILHRLPDWLADPTFAGLQPEGWEDVEVFFEDEAGKRRQAIQVKNHPVTPSKAKKIFEEFQNRAKQGERDGIDFCFRLASLGVSPKLRPVKNAVGLYQDRTAHGEAEKAGTRQDVADLIQKLGLDVPVEFLLGRVTFDTDLGALSEEDVLRHHFIMRLHKMDYGLSPLAAEYAYIELATELLRWLKKGYISRQAIEEIIQREADRHPNSGGPMSLVEAEHVLAALPLDHIPTPRTSAPHIPHAPQPQPALCRPRTQPARPGRRPQRRPNYRHRPDRRRHRPGRHRQDPTRRRIRPPLRPILCRGRVLARFR